MPATGGGDLRYRVTFSEPNSIEDEYGNVSTGFVDRFTVAANIVPLQGGETVQAARLSGRQPVTITCRQSNDTRQIKTDWRATNTQNSVVYNIRSAVDPDEGNVSHGRWMDMLAEAGVAV